MQRDKKSLESAALALGDHFDGTVCEVTASAHELQLAGTLLHEVSKPYALYAALRDRA